MSNIEQTIIMYILVIITSIIIYSTKTSILNKMVNVTKDPLLEGVYNLFCWFDYIILTHLEIRRGGGGHTRKYSMLYSWEFPFDPKKI